MRNFNSKPEFYEDIYPDYPRFYFLSGTASRNFWIDLTLPEPKWWKLTWTCIPKNAELGKMKFHSENPTEFKL
jgi:hypothetical protein